MTTENNQENQDVTSRVTPKTPAERAREYRRRKRDAATEALVTPATEMPFTPDITIQPVIPAPQMTRRDRDDLIKVTRQRGQIAKSQLEAIKAELKADVEKKLSEEFEYRDEQWREATEILEQAVRDANAQIQRVSEERGVPKEFRPKVSTVWASRGSNDDPSRRAELRKLADARIDALAKTTKLTIETQVNEVLTNLLAGGLDSEAAQQYLAEMPDPRQLMPHIEVSELQQEYKEQRQRDRRRYGYLIGGDEEES